MPSSSFFVQDGYSPEVVPTFQQLVNDAIQNAGAIGPKSVTIVNPTGSDDITLFYVNAAVTVQQITASVKGSASPSINFDIRYGATPTAIGTSVVSGGTLVSTQNVITNFDNAAIPANSYVRLVTSSMSGDVDELAVSIDF